MDNSQAGNGAESSGALDTNQAASLFASMLDPSPEREQPAGDKLTAVETATPEAEPVAAEPVAEATEPEATEHEPTVTVKIDGKDVEVPLSELKNGYQRQADYTRKTMEVSEQRKAAEAEAAKARAERETAAQALQRAQAVLEAQLQEQQQVDWAKLLETDPVEYLKQQHLAQVRQAQWQQNQQAQAHINAQREAEQAKAREAYLSEQQATLLAKLPDWKDEAKAKAEKSALREYLLTEGFDKQTVDSITDAKAVLMARKAMLYDQMMSKAQAAAKKVSTLPQKVERPGSGDSPNLDRRTAAFQRLGKSGKVEDAAAVFASLI